MSDFSELLLSAGYVRDRETFGQIPSLARPEAAAIEKFSDRLSETLELDPEALILEFVPEKASVGADTCHVVAWWDGELTPLERATITDAYREEFFVDLAGFSGA